MDIQKQNDQAILTRFLAKKAKELYLENLALRMFAQRLKEDGYQGVDDLIAEARQSPAAQRTYQDFVDAIDSKMPPEQASDDDALVEWIQQSGLNRGVSN